MSAQTSISETSQSHADTSAGPDAWERALLDQQLERLNQLADMGMALAAEIQRRAVAAAPDTDITHAAIDFARVSRAVRMTLALQSKLVRDFKTPIKAGSAKADRDDDGDEIPKDYAIYWADGTPVNHAAERNVLRETVRDLAKDLGLDAERVERLETEAVEQYEREDLYPDYPAPGNRPFHKVVALICEDLGLRTPFLLDGGRDGDGGDLSAAPRLNRHPHSRPLPNQGGEELEESLSPPFHGSS